MISKRPCVFLCAFAILSQIAGCTRKTESHSASGAEPIFIGEVGSMTGPEASFGTSTHRGIELAIEQANAEGGVQGRPLKLLSLDDQGRSDEAAIAAQKLITQDAVIALLGEVASTRSLAMAPVAQKLQTPMITPSSANERVTATGDAIFRVCFIDAFQGKVMARFAIEQLKLKKVAVFKDYKNDYSISMSARFSEAFKEAGGEIVSEQSYSAGDSDFKGQLTRIRASHPEAVFVPGYYTDVALIARQARELGITVPLLGGDGWDSPKLSEIGQKAIDGSYFVNHFSADSDSRLVKRFVKAFEKKYGFKPDGLTALGYDAAGVLIQALRKAPTLTRDALKTTLAQTQGYPGVTGTITLDRNRNPVKSAVILEVAGSQYKHRATIDP